MEANTCGECGYVLCSTCGRCMNPVCIADKCERMEDGGDEG